MNIDDINRLTGRIPFTVNERVPQASIEISVRGTPKDKKLIQKRFMEYGDKLGMDVSFQQDSMFRRMRRLICFDMDSTLIKTEVIDELARRAGVFEQVAAITESAMRGRNRLYRNFVQRCALLKGLDVSVMHDIAVNLPIMDGVDPHYENTKKVGFKIAILSGALPTTVSTCKISTALTICMPMN